MRAAHKRPLKIHDTRVGMNSSEFHDFIGIVLTDANSGHSRDILQPFQGSKSNDLVDIGIG